MMLGFETACAVFNALPDTIKAPQLNPEYIVFDAMRDTSLEPVFFLYENNGDYYYSAAHKSIIQGTDYYDLQSAYGYGGPVANTEDKFFLSKAWDAYTEWCIDNHVLVEFIRFHPILQNWKYYGGDTLFNRETVWIDLKKNDLMSEYRPRARTSARKAINNGLRVEWYNGEQFMELFVPLYYQEMRELQAEEFYVFDKDYFKGIIKWDRAKFAVCSSNQQILAAAIFLMEGDIMEYHLAAANSEGKRLCASNLILHEAGNLGKHLGYKALHLGGGTDPNPDNSLLFFKSSFSKQRAEFRIGKAIYFKEAYQELKNNWETAAQKLTDRVLFYR